MHALPDVSAAAADNLALHTRWIHERVPGMRVIADEVVTLADSGLASDTFNTVCRTRLGHGDRKRVRAVVDYFGTRGRPFAWWVGPGDSPRELGSLLEDAGLRPAETETAMAVQLGRLPDTSPAPAGLIVRRATAPEQVLEFGSTLAAVSDPPDRDVVTFYRRAAHVLLTPGCPLWLYLGYLDGHPVATAEVAVDGGVAGLYNLSTLSAHRRRGVGAALTLRSLLDARAAGARLGVLQASPEGAGVYRSARFVEVGEFVEYKPG